MASAFLPIFLRSASLDKASSRAELNLKVLSTDDCFFLSSWRVAIDRVASSPLKNVVVQVKGFVHSPLARPIRDKIGPDDPRECCRLTRSHYRYCLQVRTEQGLN